jgi:hypothetical protein
MFDLFSGKKTLPGLPDFQTAQHNFLETLDSILKMRDEFRDTESRDRLDEMINKLENRITECAG